MDESDGAKVFPVVFYDGERESNIGNVRIHPSLDLKTFQSILSRKIGISHNHMSIYLVDRTKPKLPHEDRRKILITGRVSFSLIAREDNCLILVVLKRSRREKRRKSRQSNAEFGEYLNGANFFLAPENFSLLRRSQPELNNPQFSPFHTPPEHLQELQIQRENYMAMISENRALILCEECREAKMQGNTVPFHCCINDAVTVAFRSPAGPVARPSYGSR